MPKRKYPGKSNVPVPTRRLISATVTLPPPKTVTTAGMRKKTSIAVIAPTKPARMPSVKKCFSNSRAMNRSVAPTKCKTSTISRLDASELRVCGYNNCGSRGANEDENGETSERKRAG